jgi:hypothetical protein
MTWCWHSSGCGSRVFLGRTAIGDTTAVHQLIDARAFDRYDDSSKIESEKLAPPIQCSVDQESAAKEQRGSDDHKDDADHGESLSVSPIPRLSRCILMG